MQTIYVGSLHTLLLQKHDPHFRWKTLEQGTISKFTSELPACFVVLQQRVMECSNSG